MSAKRKSPKTRSAQKKSTPPPARRLVPDTPVAVLAGVGMAITGYLTWTAGGDGQLFCGPDSGCDVVQGSRYATLLGLPIALWGFGLYTLILWFAVTDPPRRRRWRRLTGLAALGLGISVYLTITGVVALDATCAWCLASLGVMAALFGLLILRRPASTAGRSRLAYARNVAVLTVLVVGSVFAAQSGLLQPPEDPRLKALAEHLDETGARYYGAFWCPDCQEQSRLFGRSADRLPYVECTPDGRGGGIAFACVAADITGYPTWVIDGRRYREVLTPDELARYSGFRFEGEVE
jgi:uncharacterized membrane protein